MSDDPKPELVNSDADVSTTDEPPVVARLIVEIRSDGTRTIARGAVEDRTTDQKVGLQVEGTSMLSLARSLARALFEVPSMAAAARTSWRKGLRQRLALRRGKP